MLAFTETMNQVSHGLEVVGVGIIVGGFLVSGAQSGWLIARRRTHDAYLVMRATFGRAVLLGLEVLVAADIIRTVAVDPTLRNLTILGVLVLIRTFLSWSLEVEIDGRWPWQRFRAEKAAETK